MPKVLARRYQASPRQIMSSHRETKGNATQFWIDKVIFCPWRHFAVCVRSEYSPTECRKGHKSCK